LTIFSLSPTCFPASPRPPNALMRLAEASLGVPYPSPRASGSAKSSELEPWA
jgi:hypothetical protein